MSDLSTLNGQIKNGRSRIYRRLFIKRRTSGTGLYESDWQDISADVIKWGSVRKEIDNNKVNNYKFSGMSIVMNNMQGKFNPYISPDSIWFGYGDEQRTLVKIEAGFLYQVRGTNGIWTTTELPSANIVFSGFISGNINITGSNQVTLPIVPLTECFRQFSARRLTGWNSSLTASDFIELLRDQQDTSGNYIFKPFFGDTSTNFVITASTNEYANLNTSTAKDVINNTAWGIVEKLCEAENYVPLVTNSGVFKFRPRTISTTPVYEFYGVGGFSSEYGHTIKRINWYGKRHSKYYSRVSVKWAEADTSTSYEVKESSYLVNSTSGPWTLGEKSLNITNTWIPSATAALTIATELFNEFSAIREEIEFTTSLVPHLEIFDRVLVTYDPSPVLGNSLWDLYNWSDSISAADDMIWDDSGGESIKLYQKEFKLIAIDMNLDSSECKFIGRD